MPRIMQFTLHTRTDYPYQAWPEAPYIHTPYFHPSDTLSPQPTASLPSQNKCKQFKHIFLNKVLAFPSIPIPISATFTAPNKPASMEPPQGGPLQAVLLLLLTSVLYECIVRAPSSGRRTLETWWWGVYILSAPLLFGDVRPGGFLPPLIGLFFTRFVVETLELAAGHWAVAVSDGRVPLASASAAVGDDIGVQTVLPD